MTTRTPHVHAELIRAFADGYQIQYEEDGEWIDTLAPWFNKNTKYRIKPEKEYPVTSLTDDELKYAYDEEQGERLVDGFRGIANAAIKRYIDEAVERSPKTKLPNGLYSLDYLKAYEIGLKEGILCARDAIGEENFVSLNEYYKVHSEIMKAEQEKLCKKI